MPTRYSSAGSVDDAQALVDNLGIDYRVIPIDEIFQSYLDGLAEVFAGTEADVTEENIQARIRGGVLMALSNKFGRLLLTTGNKSEVAVGYSTLYGDMAGGLAVISDVPKTLVYDIARLPQPRSARPFPSRSSTRRHRRSFGPTRGIRTVCRPTRISIAWSRDMSSATCRWRSSSPRGSIAMSSVAVVELIDRAEYKRRQAAPGIKITAKAFGIGRRYPIVADYRGLHKTRD